MQSMVSIEEFVLMLNSINDKIEEEDLYAAEKEQCDIAFKYPMLFNLVKTMNFYKGKIVLLSLVKNTSLASRYVKSLTNYFDIRGGQNDAHEFLCFLFERLNKEILEISEILIMRNDKEKNKAENFNKEKDNNKSTEKDPENTNNNIIDKLDTKKEIKEKPKDLKSLLESTPKKKRPETTTSLRKNTAQQPYNPYNQNYDYSNPYQSYNTNTNTNINNQKDKDKNKDNTEKEKDLINLNPTKKSEKTENKNSEEKEEWAEVKKNGKGMKLQNTEASFDISLIGKIFEGILKHDLETKGKGTSKCLVEPFFVLSLDLADYSLDNCFSAFFSRKKVENITNPENSFYQKAYVEKLPKILIVHAKGFYYDKTAQRVVKVNKELEYDFTLKIKKEYFSPSVYSKYKENEYDLVSSN